MRATLRGFESPKPAHSGLLAAIFLAMALALGGGGSPDPLPELILECFAGLFAVLWMLGTLSAPQWRSVPRSAWIIASIIAAVPAMQLIPLPPLIWHALPGRSLELDALTLIGEQSTWRTWALAPARTLSSLLSLGPPLLLLAMTSALDKGGRVTLIRSIALMAVATVIVGALQHAAGEDSPLHFYGEQSWGLVGFQANENSTADLLLVALMTGPLLVREFAKRRLIATRPALVLGSSGTWMVICAISVVLTSSRTGIALLPIPIFASLWILRPWLPLTRRAFLVMLGAAFVAVPLGFALAQSNPVLAQVIARFAVADELRPQLWRDGLFVAQKYFPFGVGMGDFVPALVADERLEVVRQTLPNRAHNELIELTAEAGIFAMAALTAVCFMLVREVRRALRRSTLISSNLACFASTALGIFALHSMTDYPFRSLSLASLGGVCAGLLLAPRRSELASGIDQPSRLPEG